MQKSSFVKRSVALLVGVFIPGAIIAHYFGFVELANQAPIVLASSPPVTSAPVTAVSSRDWVCTTAANVVQGAPAATRTAALETDCGTRAQDGAARYIAERVVSRTTTTTTTDQTTLTRRAQAFGGTTVRVADAHAALIMVAGGGGSPSAEYDCSDAIAGVPFAIDCPTAPTITSEATVNTSTLAANIVAGRRITLQSGSYGNRTFNVNDQEIILQSGAELGAVTVSGNRIIIRGETERVGNFATGDISFSGDDILLYQATMDFGGTFGVQVFGNRTAFISSSVDAQSYAAYVHPQADNFIVGNSDMYAASGTFPSVRIFADKSVVVDSHVRTINHHAYRVHADSEDVTYAYSARNQIESASIAAISADGDGTCPASRLINVWFLDNDTYGGEFIWYSGCDPSATRPEVFTVTGNAGHGGTEWPTEELPAWTVENNTTAGSTTPPAWNFQP